VNRPPALTFAMLIALYHPFCTPRVQSTMPPSEAPLAELWQRPDNLAGADLFNGPWGPERAPDPDAIYTFVARKQQGTNPGLTVQDPRGREWHVKQPPHNDQGAEGPVEVALSRLLSAVGYHQPPIYFLSHFTVRDAKGTHVEPGGRFRLTEKSLKHTGTWSWQQNPFVGMRPYQGLLVMMMMFNSSDIKNDNNALYAAKKPEDSVDNWYVVRDLGTALGETGRFAPQRGDPDVFERDPSSQPLRMASFSSTTTAGTRNFSKTSRDTTWTSRAIYSDPLASSSGRTLFELAATSRRWPSGSSFGSTRRSPKVEASSRRSLLLLSAACRRPGPPQGGFDDLRDAPRVQTGDQLERVTADPPTN
jgi:hypothetical protein